jgi:hypothetical protein
MRFTLLLAALCLAAAPALATKTVTSKPMSPVQDHTGSSELQGVLRPGCAPWENGKSVGIELPNHIGAVIYTEIEKLKEAPGTSFKSVPGELKEGRAVIFRCSNDDSSCLQQNGSVHLTKVDDEIFLGRIETEKDQISFTLKQVPMKAGCLL